MYSLSVVSFTLVNVQTPVDESNDTFVPEFFHGSKPVVLYFTSEMLLLVLINLLAFET